MFAVAGLLFMRRNAFVAGLGIGLAGCSKVSIGIWGLAMLWAYRREPKKALLLCLGTAIPMGWAYVIWQPTAFFQALRNGGYVSVGLVGRPVLHAVRAVHDEHPRQGRRRDRRPTSASSSSAGCCRGCVPVGRRARPAQGRRPPPRPADHRAADLARPLRGLARHLDVHAVLVRPHRLDAAGRDGPEQARPADDRPRRRRSRWPTSPVGPSTSAPRSTSRRTASATPSPRPCRSSCWSPSSCGGRSPRRPEMFPFRAPKGAVASERPDGDEPGRPPCRPGT